MTDSDNHVEPRVPKSRSGGGRGTKAIIAVLIAVLLIVSALYITKITSSSSPNITPSVQASAVATTGNPFSLNISVGTSFKDVTVYFGDGYSETVPYSGTNYINVNHVYQYPGQALIYYMVHFNNGATYTSSSSLIPVSVVPSHSYVSTEQSLGIATFNATKSSNTTVANQPIFPTGSHVYIRVGYHNEPTNSSYQIISQNVTVNVGSGKLTTIPYSWNTSSAQYEASSSALVINESLSFPGVYVVSVDTYTAQVNSTTGAVGSQIMETTYFYDVAAFSNAGVYTGSSNAIFNDYSNVKGGYQSLDPAVDYELIGYEVFINTMQTLVVWNGSSSNTFVPELATHLPTIANGGINGNYANYTQETPSGTTYKVQLKPYENYTFTVRSNASWQNGKPVTAWDVEYSLARTLLFDSGSPGTPGWIRAQYMLPGNYFTSNTFYNITNNMTVDNSSNSITLHFQEPVSPTEVFDIMSAIGGEVMNSQWLIDHGAGITWTPAGFKAYESQASVSGYNNYVEKHVFSDGPYIVSYAVPGTEIFLTPNPYFNAPGPWYPKPTVKNVAFDFVGNLATRETLVRSGQMGSSVISPAHWNFIQQMVNAGKVKVYPYHTLRVNFFNFNFNINETVLHDIGHQYNVPQYLFTDINARKAFAYAYDYQYYLDYQLGNKIYNHSFGFRFAGVIPDGMSGFQSISTLNKTTTGVPYFDLSMAKHYWNLVDFAKYGITQNAKGQYIYDGNPLSIPIFIMSGFPSILAGSTTWGSELQSIVTGASFPVVSLPNVDFIDNLVPGQNPMPIFYMFWYPDYPYPTDYIAPLGLPENASFDTGGANFSPYTLSTTGHTSQAQNATDMITWYNEGSTTANNTQALMYFHKVNEMLVNMTAEVYVYQSNEFYIMSPNINGAGMLHYQENYMYAGGWDLLYNLLTFNNTAT